MNIVTSEMMRRELAALLGETDPRAVYWRDDEITYPEASWVDGSYPLKDPDLRLVTAAYRGALFKITYSTYWLVFPIEEIVKMFLRPLADALLSEKVAA